MTETESNIGKSVSDLALIFERNMRNATEHISMNKRLSTIKAGVFFQGKTFYMNLFDDVFAAGRTEYAVIFFCDYDFTKQSREDILQIHQHYSKLLECGAVAVAVTHDQLNIHQAYATPNLVKESLEFSPSFVLVSDPDHLLSTVFGSTSSQDERVQRSVHIVNSQCKLVLSHVIPNYKTTLPMELVYNVIGQA